RPLTFPLYFIDSSHSPLVFRSVPTTAHYPLSLHDALPIYPRRPRRARADGAALAAHRRLPASIRPRLRGGELLQLSRRVARRDRDRKSTRLNSSHGSISYAVFCLKNKNTKQVTALAGH